MDKETFYLSVKSLASSSDFESNNNLLKGIESPFYDDFLNCLKYGYSIPKAIKALDRIIEISHETVLTRNDVFLLLPKFISLISLLDNGS